LLGLLDERVTVHLPGGDLSIEWPGESNELLMTGPATMVFEGKINIDK
jgi:diaminopimelate epimerase